MKDDQPWIQHYRANGVVLNETDYGYGPVFILGDDLTEKEQQYVGSCRDKGKIHSLRLYLYDLFKDFMACSTCTEQAEIRQK
jgi:hypothetical protein